jgi:hypothetical protein
MSDANDMTSVTKLSAPSGGPSASASSSPIKPLPYDVKVFSFLCLLGVIIKLLFGGMSKEYATTTVYGYSFSLFALICLMVSNFALNYKKTPKGNGMFAFAKSVFSQSFPSLMIGILLALTIYQNIAFYSQINSEKVPQEFFQFSGVSSFLIIVQIGLVINYVVNKAKGLSAQESTSFLFKQINSIVSVLFITTIFLIGIIEIILKYFSTDG